MEDKEVTVQVKKGQDNWHGGGKGAAGTEDNEPRVGYEEGGGGGGGAGGGG